jgi:hypothetical protein
MRARSCCSATAIPNCSRPISRSSALPRDGSSARTVRIVERTVGVRGGEDASDIACLACLEIYCSKACICVWNLESSWLRCKKINQAAPAHALRGFFFGGTGGTRTRPPVKFACSERIETTLLGHAGRALTPHRRCRCRCSRKAQRDQLFGQGQSLAVAATTIASINQV